MHTSQLKQIFLFCRKALSTASPFDPFLVSLHTVCPTWNISQHNFVSNKLGNYVSCYHSCIYISPRLLSSPSLFSTTSTPDFPNTSCWFSPILNTLIFRIICFFSFLPNHLFFHPSSIFSPSHPSFTCYETYYSHVSFPYFPPAIPSYSTHQCISNFFAMQPLPVKDQ